jgi:DNA polymerase-3 subunit chi
MADVAFHTGVDDKLGYACRLLRKAYRQGARVAVSGAAPLLQQLDQALWTFEPQEFVPHLRLGAGFGMRDTPPQRLLRTPIWLVDPGAQPPDVSVLVNLGPERQPGDEAYARIIEIVSRAPVDVSAGRRRWKQYESLGWAITHHALGSGA